MLKLSKKVEYGLIAMRHIASINDGKISTAKEIATAYHISQELLAKVLQKLAKEGLVISHQGMRGGYALARRADQISISTIINAIEGQLPRITQCTAETPQSCSIFEKCTIKNPLGKIQGNIEEMFSAMTVSEII
ncbi:MAG: Rrf2 family transcriptional regulator [Ignavibacteriales bacterium]|nr:Rrf2 family transcriptional regulator [Ignavibacteriales bacterium]